MGSIALPTSGEIYFDAQSVIYSVERHPVYAAVLDPLWHAVQTGLLTAVLSELTILEALVGPLKQGDVLRQQAFESLFIQPHVRLVPVSETALRRAAQLRARLVRLRTPDAIHAATALEAGVALFVTNDFGFRGIPGLPVEVLDDVIARP